jgi:hypothetical protein
VVVSDFSVFVFPLAPVSSHVQRPSAAGDVGIDIDIDIDIDSSC